MQLRPAIQVSQDARNWTILDLAPPIPVALLSGYAYVRVVLLWMAEPGDTEAIRLPAPNSPP